VDSSVRIGLAIGSFTVAYGLFTIAATLAARVPAATAAASGSMTATQPKAKHDWTASHDDRRNVEAIVHKDAGVP